MTSKKMQVYILNGKLRCYLLFKCNFGFENYLSIVRSFEHRKNITKLRTSAHKLQIEVGRYQGTLPQNHVCHIGVRHRDSVNGHIFFFNCFMCFSYLLSVFIKSLSLAPRFSCLQSMCNYPHP